jgi:hypothetical protein
MASQAGWQVLPPYRLQTRPGPQRSSGSSVHDSPARPLPHESQTPRLVTRPKRVPPRQADPSGQSLLRSHPSKQRYGTTSRRSQRSHVSPPEHSRVDTGHSSPGVAEHPAVTAARRMPPKSSRSSIIEISCPARHKSPGYRPTRYPEDTTSTRTESPHSSRRVAHHVRRSHTLVHEDRTRESSTYCGRPRQPLWVRIECGGLKSHDFGLLRA